MHTQEGSARVEEEDERAFVNEVTLQNLQGALPVIGGLVLLILQDVA